ncbi:hypothetical protein [Microbacterium sp.]|uniref:hypothetical protein n=1 Tax=Microbacterium sp. TaxID=51671 RepID=UPI0039E63F1E
MVVGVPVPSEDSIGRVNGDLRGIGRLLTFGEEAYSGLWNRSAGTDSWLNLGMRMIYVYRSADAASVCADTRASAASCGGSRCVWRGGGMVKPGGSGNTFAYPSLQGHALVTGNGAGTSIMGVFSIAGQWMDAQLLPRDGIASLSGLSG